MRGMYNLPCWEGLSASQQERLMEWGNLPFGSQPEGKCTIPAQVEITTVFDKKPGPRFYCIEHAVVYLSRVFNENQGAIRDGHHPPMPPHKHDGSFNQCHVCGLDRNHIIHHSEGWEANAYSMEDGSPARLVGIGEKGLITLQNEDGYEWEDHIEAWRIIGHAEQQTP